MVIIATSPAPASWQRSGGPRAYLLTARPTADQPNSALQKREQIGVDLVLLRRADPVRSARVDLQRRVLDQLRRAARGRGERNDLVVVAVEDQRRHVELRQVRREVGFGERPD